MSDNKGGTWFTKGRYYMSDLRIQALTRSLLIATERIDTLDAKLKFDLGVAGIVFLNGTVTPCEVNNVDGDADCVVEMDIGTLEEIMAGRTDSQTAFTQGKMCLVGDMSVAIKLVALVNGAVVQVD
jgi:putative sterol carrier protein